MSTFVSGLFSTVCINRHQLGCLASHAPYKCLLKTFRLTAGKGRCSFEGISISNPLSLHSWPSITPLPPPSTHTHTHTHSLDPLRYQEVSDSPPATATVSIKVQAHNDHHWVADNWMHACYSTSTCNSSLSINSVVLLCRKVALYAKRSNIQWMTMEALLCMSTLHPPSVSAVRSHHRLEAAMKWVI